MNQGQYFGEMLGAFGQEVAELVHHLVAHMVRAARHDRVFLRDFAGPVSAPQLGIEVAPGIVPAVVPALVLAGGAGGALFCAARLDAMGRAGVSTSRRPPICPAPLERQEEGDMVDAGHLVAHVVDGNVEVMAQLEDRVRHRVAQPDIADGRVSAGDGPAVDGHGVHILKHQGVRAERAHVLAQLPQKRHGAKPAHDAADAERVADGLAKPV